MPEGCLTIVETRLHDIYGWGVTWVVLDDTGETVYCAISFGDALGYVWTRLFLYPAPALPCRRPVA